MEPVSFLLMSLGPTRMAIRGIAASMENAAPTTTVEYEARCKPQPRKEPGLRALSEATLRPRRLMRRDTAGMVDLLNRIASAEGLMVSAQVALSALFDTSGNKAAARALEGRAIDLLLSTADGVPICGIDVVETEGPAFRDHTAVRAFHKAGLPLVAIPADASLETVSAKLCQALGLGPAQPPEAAAAVQPAPRDEDDVEINNIFEVQLVA